MQNTTTTKATETTVTICRAADHSTFTYQCGCTHADQLADKCTTHTPDGTPRKR